MTLKIWKNNQKRYLLFTKKDILDLFRQEFFRAAPEIMNTLGISFEDLGNDREKMIKVSNLVSEKIFKETLVNELFQAWHIFSNFYEEDSEIGIELKDNAAEKELFIRNLDDLKKITKIDTLIDFVIYSKSGVRLFQLKNYHGCTLTQDLLVYLKSVLIHYSKNLGSVNLLIVLSRGGSLNIDFEILAYELRTLNLKSDSWVMISFNENNEKIVINQIFPNLTRSEIPFTKLSNIR